MSIFEAVDGQTVVVVGTETGGLVLPRLAAQMEQLQAQWKETAAEIGKLVEDHPLTTVLTSLPGVGTRTAGIALAEVCGTTFPTSAHLASYAGIAPVTAGPEHPAGASTAQRAATRSSNVPSTWPRSHH